MIANTSTERIDAIIASQRLFFSSHLTLAIDYRIDALRKLRSAIVEREARLCRALYDDLHKSCEEAYLTEISILLGEIDNFIKNLTTWAAPSRKRTPLKMWPSRSEILTQPLGIALIIAPWNYPVQLLLNPLIGAIGAGCTAVLKPSPYTPNVARELEELIRSVFDEEYVAVVQGNRDVNTALLERRYDIIFFTGSPTLGRVVMRAAAEHITPVVLELGGKSPVVVDSTANVELAARRVAWGKTLNAGQTCIAPDYVLLPKHLRSRFVEAFAEAVADMHGRNIRLSKHYGRMVSDAAFRRVAGYMSEGEILYGGDSDLSERYIEPTLLANVAQGSSVLSEEIFGPILPIIEVESSEEAIAYINAREKPLALYVFAEPSVARHIFEHTSSGGGCINDTIMHIANENMPFGGVGNSGMGRYHGRDSLYTFSHRRSVITTPTWIDLPFRYMPYRLFSWVKRLL